MKNLTNVVIFLLLLSIPIILIYCAYSLGNEWYECDKNKGQYIKTIFGYTCILPK
jgi:hypothetical protein